MPKTPKKLPSGQPTSGPASSTTAALRSRKPLPEAEKPAPSRSSARTQAEKAARFQQLRADAMKRWRARD